MPVQLNSISAQPIAAPQAVRSMAAVADPRQDSTTRLEQMAVGKFLNAQVVDRLSSGSWLVRVTQPATTQSLSAQAAETGLEVHMQLPTGIQLGDKLELTLLAREPHLTFGIGYPNPATTTTLSPTARLIDQLLHQAEQAQQPHHVVGQAALLPDVQAATQDVLAPQLANQLQQALERSGLFYESHLRQWANGERSLAQIRQEPQNQTDSPQASGLQASAQVPLQLDTLEQRHFAWQGEFWPGQPLQWEVSKDGRGNGSAEPGAAAAAWNTVLKLELPELGSVDVRIRLQGQRVQLQVRAERELAIARLHAERQRLDDALAAAGTALDGFMVQRDAHA